MGIKYICDQCRGEEKAWPINELKLPKGWIKTEDDSITWVFCSKLCRCRYMAMIYANEVDRLEAIEKDEKPDCAEMEKDKQRHEAFENRENSAMRQQQRDRLRGDYGSLHFT